MQYPPERDHAGHPYVPCPREEALVVMPMPPPVPYEPPPMERCPICSVNVRVYEKAFEIGDTRPTFLILNRHRRAPYLRECMGSHMPVREIK